MTRSESSTRKPVGEKLDGVSLSSLVGRVRAIKEFGYELVNDYVDMANWLSTLFTPRFDA